MTGRKLFMKRLLKEWRYQLGVMGSVFDWTIVVYLLVPAIILAPFLYVDMWEYIHLYWSDKLPIWFLLFLVLLLSGSGNFRTYLMEADLLYLLQRKKLIRRLKMFGLLYSVMLFILGVAVMMVIILPILMLIYHWTPLQVVSLFLAILAYRMILFTLKKIISGNWFKWTILTLFFFVSLYLILIVDSVSVGICSIILMVGVIVFHFTQITKTNRWFYREIEIEQAEAVRYIKLIFAFSMQVEKEIISTRKKPLLLFRKSGRLFTERNAENGMLELIIKAFLRNKSYLTTYAQIILVTGSAVTVLPIWIKWLIYFLFLIFLHSWLKSIFDKMLTSRFFEVVPYKKDLVFPVWERFKKRFYRPAALFVGGMTVLATLISVIFSRVFGG